MMPESKLFLVDDEESIRDSLQALFGSRRIAATSFPDAVRFLAAWSASNLRDIPAVFLVDVRMPMMSGLELFDRLRHLGMPAYNLVIFLTAHGEISMAVEAIKAGAYDFLEKPFSGNTLVDKVVASLRYAERLFVSERKVQLTECVTPLTMREQEIAERIAAGKTNRIIGEELSISVRTVEVHRAKLFQKLNVKNAIELVKVIGKA